MFFFSKSYDLLERIAPVMCPRTGEKDQQQSNTVLQSNIETKSEIANIIGRHWHHASKKVRRARKSVQHKMQSTAP
jgi:hypothetical protein